MDAMWGMCFGDLEANRLLASSSQIMNKFARERTRTLNCV